MHNTLKGVSVQSIAILGMGVPALAKVTQSRDNISSLIETIVNPPSNLRSTIRDIILYRTDLEKTKPTTLTDG